MNEIDNLNFSKAVKELLPKLLNTSLQIVVVTTILGFLLAMVLGYLLAFGKISKHKVLNHVIIVFQEIIRGTPLLVQMVYMFYVIPLLIEIIVRHLGLSSFSFAMSSTTAGTLALGINYGTYLSEVIRSAIISIDRGQTEAALALGFSSLQSMCRIVLPQATKNSIPIFGNYFVMMVKDTSLMAYITAPEFLMTTQAYTAQTFLTIESYTILAGVYLIICIPIAFLIKYLERKFNKTIGKRSR